MPLFPRALALRAPLAAPLPALLAVTAAGALVLPLALALAGPAFAQTAGGMQDRARERIEDRDFDSGWWRRMDREGMPAHVYGYEHMTEAERTRLLERLRAAHDAPARRRVMEAHRAWMHERYGMPEYGPGHGTEHGPERGPGRGGMMGGGMMQGGAMGAPPGEDRGRPPAAGRGGGRAD